MRSPCLVLSSVSVLALVSCEDFATVDRDPTLCPPTSEFGNYGCARFAAVLTTPSGEPAVGMVVRATVLDSANAAQPNGLTSDISDAAGRVGLQLTWYARTPSTEMVRLRLFALPVRQSGPVQPVDSLDVNVLFTRVGQRPPFDTTRWQLRIRDASGPPAAPLPDTVRVANCVGPASSLPDTVVAGFRASRGPVQTIDDLWADLADSLPGGFAGVLYDPGLQPVLLLTQPELADAAKRALAPRIPGFPVASAVVRQARWNFAQLVFWNYYFYKWLPLSGLVMSDNNERLNRIHFGVLDQSARDRFIHALGVLSIPCDLVLITIRGPINIG